MRPILFPVLAALAASVPAQRTEPPKTLLLLVEGSLDHVTVTRAWRKPIAFRAIAVPGERRAVVRLAGAGGKTLATVALDLSTVILDPGARRPVVEGDRVREVGIHALVKLPDLGARIARVDIDRVAGAGLRTIGSIDARGLLRLLQPSSTPLAAPTVKTHLNNGPSANRYDIVILAEGYRAVEQAKFHADVARWMSNLFAKEPFKTYRKFFNVHSVHNPSKQSGADHPDRSPPIVKDTVYNATYNYGGTGRCLYIRNTSQARADAALAPDVEGRIVVFVNDSRYGGCAGAFAVSYNGSSGPEVQSHEFGHSYGGLADEYDYGRSGTYSGPEPRAANITADKTCAKWSLWKGTNGVGCFEGAGYYKKGLWRPKSNCLMRALGRPLCPVCVEEMTKDGYSTVNPIEDAKPKGSGITLRRPGSQTFSFTDLVPGGGRSRWFVDGSLKQSSGTSFVLASTTYPKGLHTVKLEVTDSSPLVRKDPSKRLVRTRLWSVSISDPAVPDLRPFAVNTVSSSHSGKTIAIDAWITNAGNGVSPATTADFYLSKDATITTADTWLGSSPVLPIVPLGTTLARRTVQLPFFADKGTRWIGVQVDRRNTVAESNETNNTMARTIAVLGPQGCVTRLEFDSKLQPLGSNAVSAATGGTSSMVLTAPCLASHWYLVQWTCSGTTPGIRLPSGHVLPINFDSCTAFALSLVNSPIMPRFFGRLDASGHGRPAFVLPRGLRLTPFASHFAAWFAAPSLQPFTGTTNAVQLTVVR